MTLIERLAARPGVEDLEPEDAVRIGALRGWVALRKAGRCATGALIGRLGSARAAAGLHLLLEQVGAAWPEPFAVSPPCCRRLSHDEATLAEMLALARSGDRPGFDRLLAEMVPADARERLFTSAALTVRGPAA